MPRKAVKRVPEAPKPQEPIETQSFHPEPPERLWRKPAMNSTYSVKQLAQLAREGMVRVPPFQRSFVWDDEHVLHLLDSLIQGFYIGNITLWEQYKLPAQKVSLAGLEFDGHSHGCLIVDGQQRVGSIARFMLTPRYAFDFSHMAFVVRSEPGRDVIPLHLLENTLAILDGLKNDLWSPEQAGWLNDKLIYRTVCATVLPHTWEIDQVMEMFRRMNTAGVRMEADEVEAALRRARG